MAKDFIVVANYESSQKIEDKVPQGRKMKLTYRHTSEISTLRKLEDSGSIVDGVEGIGEYKR